MSRVNRKMGMGGWVTWTTVGVGSSGLHCSASFFRRRFAFLVDILGCEAFDSAKNFKLYPNIYLQQSKMKIDKQ